MPETSPTDIPPADSFGKFLSSLSTISLLGTAFLSCLIVPSIRPGFYGGTDLLVALGLTLQTLLLLLGAVVPIAVQALRRRLHIPRKSLWLLGTAAAGLLLELAALILIPVTGHC